GKYQLVAHEGSEEGMMELFSTVPIVIGENEWTLVVESEFDDVVKLVRNLNNIRTAIVFLIMLAMTVGGFFLYRWMATRLMAEEKERLLNALHQEKENLDSILKSIGAAMAVYNKDLTTFWRNEIYDEIAGGKIHIPGIGCCLRLDAKEEKYEDCAVVSTFSDGEPIKVEKKVIDKNGEVTYYLINTTPLKDSSGDIFRVMELVLDVTETKTLESQLLQSEKLASIGELASGIAHELNNPMTGIIGYSELLMEEIHDENLRRDAEHIHHEAFRCSKIIQNLLTFARRQQPQEDPVMLNSVLDTTVEMIEYEFKVHNIKIEKDYEPSLKIISGDGFQLQQVFLNILNNAFYFLKYRGGHGHVWIETRNTKKGVRVTLENDGPKLDEGVLQKIFEPFFTTKDVGMGTGLGLSISHGIVKSHGGEISAVNTKRGIAFMVDFTVKT
ncbi:MAG: ATP-binding protein, partial [Nitrospinota bacterium]